MTTTLRNTLKLVVLTLPLSLAACATTSEMNALSERVDRAQATADEALSKANAAQTTADQAAASSMDASRKADQAAQTANDAKAAADQANEKLNRAFKKSMEK
ncbi:MAG TPA: Lpp/OprI family alanine-zipper lipoprotein [Gammaproteobacteria bacterium]